MLRWSSLAGAAVFMSQQRQFTNGLLGVSLMLNRKIVMQYSATTTKMNVSEAQMSQDRVECGIGSLSVRW